MNPILSLFVTTQKLARVLFYRDLMTPRYYFRKLTKVRIPKSIYTFVQMKAPYALPFPRMPYVISIEVSGVCNLSCIMCPYPTYQGEKGLMDMDLYRKIIDQAAKEGVHTVRFVGLGEPMLHPEFFEMVKLAKSRNIYAALSTNGTQLTQENSEKLLEAGIDEVGFSIDAADPSELERIRKGAKYDDLMGKIDTFLNLCYEWKNLGKNTPVTSARMVIINPESVKTFTAAWSGRVDSLQFNKLRLYPNTPFAEDPAVIAAAKENASDIIERKVRCRLVRSYMVIRWDGKVRLCNQADTIVGDASNTSLDDIWKSPLISAVRKRHLEYQGCSVKSCRICPVMEPMMAMEKEVIDEQDIIDA